MQEVLQLKLLRGRSALVADACPGPRSFCRECVEAELVGSSGGNICPACARDGERTLLGANPFAYHRLQPDFVLEALVRKIFPRHILADYEKRRPKVHLSAHWRSFVVWVITPQALKLMPDSMQVIRTEWILSYVVMCAAQYVPQRIGQLITEPGTRPSRARGQQMPPADVVPLFLHQKVLPSVHPCP